MDVPVAPFPEQLWEATRSRPGAGGAAGAAGHQAQGRAAAFHQQYGFHAPLATSILDAGQHLQVTIVAVQHPGRHPSSTSSGGSSSSGLLPYPPSHRAFNRSHSLPATSTAGGTAAAAASLPPAASAGGSGAGSPLPRLGSSSGGSSFLGSFSSASQLLSSLTASLSLLGSSPRSRSGSGGGGGSPITSRATLGRLRSGRRASLVRAAALLQDSSEAEESYDDLLALDRFAIKRGVKPHVVAGLPRRLPSERDKQQHMQCLICLEGWAPAATADDCSCCGWGCRLCVESSFSPSVTTAGRDCCSSSDRRSDQQQQPQPVVTVMALPCGHEFCCSCISTWLIEHVTCPVCRWAFPDDATRLLNFHK